MTEMSPAEAVYFAVAALPAADRPAYLAQACGGDDELRRRVERMLAARPEVGDFLERPPAGPVAIATGALAPHAPPAGAANADFPGRAAQAGMVVGGKYTLVEPIAEGGMGMVWRARQTEPVKRFVAVKLIKAGMDSKQVLARFEAERQALALMDHPNIAKVLDGGLHEGRPYFVMELVKGVPITAYCDQRKLTPRERLELFVPVCQAIQHAHQKGVIHRDIKPSNVLIALYDDKPVVKVIDFGVAKATGGALTERTIDTGFGGVVGTPQYMSPEQATFNNLDIDTRSDVYALGVLLYELLTGSPPFAKAELEKRGLLEMLRVVREEEPPRPSTKLSTAEALPTLSANRGTEPKKLTGLLRNELDWIVMKALEKDRARRYETANGFAADVQRYLSGEAVQAHPPSAAYRLKKFVRRHRPQVVAAGLVLAALIAGIAGTTWGLFEARSQERLAHVATDEERQAKAREAERAEGERLAKLDAEEKRREAAAADAASRRGLAGQYVSRGGRLLDEGHFADALAWFAAAWRAEADVIDADRAAVHRLRVAATAQLAPKPIHVWQHGKDQGVGIQLSPDGRKVVTITRARGQGPAAGNVRVWDLESGRPLTPPIPHGPAVVSMSRDGRRLVTESGPARQDSSPQDRLFGWTARVWDAETGQPVSPPLPSSGSGQAALSPDGTRLLTVVLKSASISNVRTFPIVPAPEESLSNRVGDSGEARVWDARSGAPVTPALTLFDGVTQAAFTPDGTRVVTTVQRIKKGASADKFYVLWDAATGQALTPALRTTYHAITSVTGYNVAASAWTADRTRLVAVEADAPPDAPPRIWDARTGRPLTGPIPLDGIAGPDCHISPDGTRLAFRHGGTKPEFRLADAATGKTIATLDSGKVERPAYTVGFSSDSRWLYVTSAPLDRPRADLNAVRDWVQVWDARTGQARTIAIPFEGAVDGIRLSDDGGRLLIRGRATVNNGLSGGVQVWTFPDGTPTTPIIRHRGRVTAGAFGADGRQVLTSGGTDARVWDADTGRPRTAVLSHPREVTDAAFTPDGRLVVTACASGRVTVWPARSGEPDGHLVADGELTYRLAVDPTGTRLLTAATLEPQPSGATAAGVNILSRIHSSTVRMTDLTTGRTEVVGEMTDPTYGYPLGVFSPGGPWVVVQDTHPRPGYELRCWNARTFERVATIHLPKPALNIWFADDSTVVYEHLAAPDKGKNEVRAVRLPGGDPVTPVPSAPRRAPAGPAVQLSAGVTAQLKRPSPLPTLVVEPDGGVVDGWTDADAQRIWTAGRQTPMLRAMTLAYHRSRNTTVALEVESVRFEIRAWDARSGEPALPPLAAQGVIARRVSDAPAPDPARPRAHPFAGTNRFGVAYPTPDGVRVWDIPIDDRPAADWGRVADAVSGKRVGEGGLVSLSAPEWAAARTAVPESVGHLETPAAWASRAAAEAERANDRPVARLHLDRLIALEPNDWRHHRRRGKVSEESSEDSVRVNTRAIELGATAWQVWHNRGLAYAHLGQWSEAEADLARAVEMAKDGRSWSWLLRARLALGDLPGYRKALADATALAGETGHELKDFNWSAMAVLVPDPFADPAPLQALYDRMKRVGPGLARFGAVCVRLGRFEEALPSLLTPGPSFDPGPGEYLPLLAVAYHGLGKAAEAREALGRATDWLARFVERLEPDPATGRPVPLDRRVEFAALLREVQDLVADPPPRELGPAVLPRLRPR